MAENGVSQQQTFLFADMAGYTALTEAHGDDHAAEVVGDFCQTVRSLLAEHGASEVKSIGDAVMLHFDDPAAAVDIARHIVDELGARHAFPTVRVGVHTGAAVERDGDWFGSAVNVAARVTGEAGERDVLVTSATRDAARGGVSGIQFVPAGARRLKNVTEPVEVFRAVPLGEQSLERLPIDPVCRMVIDFGRAPATATHRGVQYPFCSERCHDAFAKNPTVYAHKHRPGGHLLISDDARERVVRRLGRAYRHGRIAADELEQRVERAYEARTRSDLQAITDDLPRHRPRTSWWRLLLPWTWFRRRRRRR